MDGRGRPSTRLRVNDTDTTVLAADLGATHGRLAVATAAGEVLAETVIESAIAKGPTAVLGTVTSEFDRLLTDLGAGRREPARDRPRRARAGGLDDRSDRPLDQHAGLGRLPGTRRAGGSTTACRPSWTTTPTCWDWASSGGSTRPLTWCSSSRSAPGSAPRWSSTARCSVAPTRPRATSGTPRSSGSRRPAAAAGPAAAWRPRPAAGPWCGTCAGWATTPRPPGTWSTWCAPANPDAVRIVTAAGRALGDVLSTAVSLLNPDVVVIGGDIAHAHEHFLLGVRETLLRAQPAAGDRPAAHRADRAG